jgi:predicted dinucleotide-binding enzyme
LPERHRSIRCNHSRPRKLASAAAAIGPTIIPKKLAEAVKADIVFLAVRFESHQDVAKVLPTWKGKTVIDAMNSFPVPPEELDDLPSSAFVAKSFIGAKLVKGFNHLVAATLATDPIVEGGHRVVFLSSDDEDAIAPVADLAKQLGFAPVKLGKLNEGARWCTHAAALGVSSSSRICSRRSSNR